MNSTTLTTIKANKIQNLVSITELKGLWGSFPCTSHKSMPWKTVTTKVYQYAPVQPRMMRVTRKKNVKTTELMGLRSFSMYITQFFFWKTRVWWGAGEPGGVVSGVPG